MTDEFDIEVIDHDDRKLLFLVRGITPAFANGIRRSMIADVPTLSIDRLRVIENSSVMFNEQIGLRLGLIPLTTPVDDFEPGEYVTLSIDVEGPGTAYSGDLVSSDELVEPADKNIPIIDLKDGQRLELEADAIYESGKYHPKQQGGVAVGYRNLQRVTILDDLNDYADDEPIIIRGVIEEDGELIPTAEFGNDLRNRYPDKEVAVEDVQNALVFSVESDGSFPVETLVDEAAKSIGTRAKALEDAVAL